MLFGLSFGPLVVVTHIVLDRHALTRSFDVSCAELLLL